MNAEISKAITESARAHFVDPKLLLAIANNESGGDPEATPYFEKTWKYFTDRNGAPLGLKGTTEEIQEKAKKKLGEDEFNFQVHASGCFQVVGSVLRELGWRSNSPPYDIETQAKFACAHIVRLAMQFKKKFGKMPSTAQALAMYNGGLGAVTADGYLPQVKQYVEKGMKFYKELK